MTSRRPGPSRRTARRRPVPAESPAGETVRIERLAAGGDGVARLAEGKTVFVPRTVPGDLVLLGPLRHQARFARGGVDRIVEPGPGRTAPRCLHFDADQCGGCQWQQLEYPRQLDAKRSIVSDALRRIGGLELDVPPVIPSDQAWGYRSRITLALAPGRRHAGFHPLDRPDRVFELARCEIAAPGLMQLWARVRPHLHLLPADADQLGLRLDPAGALHLLVHSGGARAWTRGTELAARLGPPEPSIWWQPAGGAARVVAGRRETGFAPVFEQVNPVLAGRIRRLALDLLGPVSGRLVWDLYAGSGETTLALVRAGARVESVELDAAAVAVAERRLQGESAAVLRQGRAEDLADRLPGPDAVIANPPRGGLGRPVAEALRRRRPGRLVYVSCDPATLARDLALLCEGGVPGQPPLFRPGLVQPFDLFPQTAHVETVAMLEAA